MATLDDRLSRAVALVGICAALVAAFGGFSDEPESPEADAGAASATSEPGNTEAWRRDVDVSALMEAAGRSPFASVCSGEASDPLLCQDLGKAAFNFGGSEIYSEFYIGPIIGVTFKRKGALISRSDQDWRLAPRDGWYYIIGPGGVADYTFLRSVRTIDPRPPSS